LTRLVTRTKWGAGICALLLLAACSSGTPDSRPLAAAPTLTRTPVTPAPRGTLPLTWTPTPTVTPAPPTDTPTPQPSPSPTPTLSAADLCQSLWLVTNLRDGGIYGWEDIITVLVSLPAADAKLQFRFKPHGEGEERGVDLPGGESIGWQVKIRDLPKAGQYDWRLGVATGQYGDICQQSGFFIATSQESTRAEENSIR
jgi:hypothetical protein